MMMRTWIVTALAVVTLTFAGKLCAEPADELAVLKKASALAKTVVAKREIVISAMKLATESVEAGDYDTAKASSLLAVTAARATRGAALLQRATQQQVRHNDLLKQWKDVQQAQLELRVDSENPNANETVGRFTALSLQKWTQGVPYLAKSSDEKLRDAAAADQKNPEEPAQQEKVADLWWTAAAVEAKKDRGKILTRSAYWYELAAPKLTGVGKQLAEKRLQECYEAMAGRDFKKILGEPANGFQSIGTIECDGSEKPAIIADSFSLQRSWMLTLEYNTSNFESGEHIMFGWGDSRSRRNPITMMLDGSILVCGTTDCENNIEQTLLRPKMDELSGKWVNVKWIHDAVDGELELYVNGKLEGKALLTIVPNADRKMQGQVGGIPGNKLLRFFGQIRGVWLGNIK